MRILCIITTLLLYTLTLILLRKNLSKYFWYVANSLCKFTFIIGWQKFKNVNCIKNCLKFKKTLKSWLFSQYLRYSRYLKKRTVKNSSRKRIFNFTSSKCNIIIDDIIWKWKDYFYEKIWYHSTLIFWNNMILINKSLFSRGKDSPHLERIQFLKWIFKCLMSWNNNFFR